MVAGKLAKRVIVRRMSYGHAEDALMLQRAGSHYQRLYQAEDEAARAVSAALGRFEQGQVSRGSDRARQPLPRRGLASSCAS